MAVDSNDEDLLRYMQSLITESSSPMKPVGSSKVKNAVGGLKQQQVAYINDNDQRTWLLQMELKYQNYADILCQILPEKIEEVKALPIKSSIKTRKSRSQTLKTQTLAQKNKK